MGTNVLLGRSGDHFFVRGDTGGWRRYRHLDSRRLPDFGHHAEPLLCLARCCIADCVASACGAAHLGAPRSGL